MKNQNVKPMTQKMVLPSDLSELAKQYGEVKPETTAKEATKEATGELLNLNRQLGFYLTDERGKAIFNKYLIGMRKKMGTDFDLGNVYLLRRLFANKKLSGVVLSFIRKNLTDKAKSKYLDQQGFTTGQAMQLLSLQIRSAKAGEPLLPARFIDHCIEQAHKLEAKKVLRLK